MTNHPNRSRLPALLAKKAARSLLAVAETGKQWSLADAERCLPLGWRLSESFAADRGPAMTVDALASAFRQFASKI
ncbi:hypothetical protein [Telmatospirillum sp.]|uniref:hypothetical protein n=1 Tax=Telmatospirillum sp. TaxID=2079197 RepID=UPI00284C805A|nr:hypothetical protein [Telmatospirillum sp.]MDR3435146.1 hypothetical protein [Telmatospirillum sp.]